MSVRNKLITLLNLKLKINRSGLEREASKMLSEGGIAVDDKILGLVVKRYRREHARSCRELCFFSE